MAVKIIGMLHGILFIAYFFMALLALGKLNWGVKMLVISMVCAIFPFGFVFMEKQFFAKLEEGS